MVRVVALQRAEDADAFFLKQLLCAAVNISAGCIGRTVGPVRAYGKNADILHSRYVFGGCQSKLLISAAKSAAGYMNNGLAAGNECALFRVSGVLLSNVREKHTGILCCEVRITGS